MMMPLSQLGRECWRLQTQIRAERMLLPRTILPGVPEKAMPLVTAGVKSMRNPATSRQPACDLTELQHLEGKLQWFECCEDRAISSWGGCATRMDLLMDRDVLDLLPVDVYHWSALRHLLAAQQLSYPSDISPEGLSQLAQRVSRHGTSKLCTLGG